MNLLWPTRIDGIGERYGYSRAGSLLADALIKIGVTLYDKRADVDKCAAAVHFIPADRFYSIVGIKNILFTMFEADPIPDWWQFCIRQADLIITPSDYCTTVFRKYSNGISVKTCPLGVDSEKFSYHERRINANGYIRFLWCGAPQVRKGWDTLGKAFSLAFKQNDLAQLYVKTSGQNGRIMRYYDGRIIVDSRPISEDELISLYHSSHILINSSRGEGFGMIPLEFMSTGGLVISSRNTAMETYIDGAVAEVVETYPREAHYGTDIICHDIKPERLAEAMRRVYDTYDLSLDKRVRARERAEFFTWERSARRLVRLVEIFAENRREKACTTSTSLTGSAS